VQGRIFRVIFIAYFRRALKTKQLLSKFLFGLSVPQQYVCLSSEDLSSPLRITLTGENNQEAIQVDPVFVGYKPVVFALPDKSMELKEKEYCLNFQQGTDFVSVKKWNGFPTDNHSVARMLVSSLSPGFRTCPHIRLLKGEIGAHSFLRMYYQVMNSLRDKFTKNGAGNVNLPGNLHDMVRIAYSVPRIIALVSVAEGFQMNLFPTDLHGKLDENFYISSLRIGGNAQQQVESRRRIVLSEIESNFFGLAYSLGKNHMKELSSRAEFVLENTVSEKFRFPLPAGVLRYFELTVLESVDVGIHRIFLYKIENVVNVRSGKTLSHIHQYYAEWRKRNGLQTDLLLR
jgi:Flavin reductase like domain